MKLEDIDKQNIFQVPDRYFDSLPSRVQERLSKKQKQERMVVWKLTAASLVPVTLLLLLLVFPGLLRQETAQSGPEAILAEIAAEDVVAYLVTTNISTEEILENMGESLVDMSIDPDNPQILQDMEVDDNSIDSIMEHYGLDTEIYENI